MFDIAKHYLGLCVNDCKKIMQSIYFHFSPERRFEWRNFKVRIRWLIYAFVIKCFFAFFPRAT